MKNHINIPKSSAAQSFIAGAPDAKVGAPTKDDELQKQISLKLPAELLDKVDAAARGLRVSRAAFIKMHLSRAVEG